MLALAAAALTVAPSSPMRDAWLAAVYSTARCWWMSVSRATTSGTRTAASMPTCSATLAGRSCSRALGAPAPAPAPAPPPVKLPGAKRTSKSVIDASGSGSMSLTSGVSRATSALECTPSSTLHGSFLRERPFIMLCSRPFIRRPTASAGAGRQNGSDRTGVRTPRAISCAVSSSVSRVSTRIAASFAWSRSPSSTRTRADANVCSCTKKTVSIATNERVTPEAALGSARSHSAAT